MTFLTNLGDFFVNNFALSDAESNTSRSFNREGIADLTLLRTLLRISYDSPVSGNRKTLLFC